MTANGATVGIVDIGSNSIKMLVASRGISGGVVEISHATEDTRIGDGISDQHPCLRPQNMDRAIRSIHVLLAQMVPYGPKKTAIVATSAVRDARNGREFAERVEKETGHRLSILSGNEEARLIGEGIACDPGLLDIADFYLFDLGGGSMECLRIENRCVTAAVSLPLGCVRTTEKFIRDRTAPIEFEELEAVRQTVRESLHQADFPLTLSRPSAAVVTGGTATNARFILWGDKYAHLSDMPRELPVDQLEALLEQIRKLPLETRKDVPFLPPSRADVFPAALATLCEAARIAGCTHFRHSVYNLRFGLATELLDSLLPEKPILER